MIQTRRLHWLDYDNQIQQKKEEQEIAHSNGIILKLPFSSLKCDNCNSRVKVFGYRRVSTFFNGEEVTLFFDWKVASEIHSFSVYEFSKLKELVCVQMVKMVGFMPVCKTCFQNNFEEVFNDLELFENIF